MLKLKLMKQPTVISQLSTQAARDKKNRDMLLKQLSSLRYLLRQQLVSKKYLSHDILSEQIRLMANHLLRKLLQEIREDTVYALIADEATDISHKEQLCITVRRVDSEFTVHEDPLDLINVPKTDSATLTASIKDGLVRFYLPIRQCRGQAYDGASNMLGRINGCSCMHTKPLQFMYTAWPIVPTCAFKL